VQGTGGEAQVAAAASSRCGLAVGVHSAMLNREASSHLSGHFPGRAAFQCRLHAAFAQSIGALGDPHDECGLPRADWDKHRGMAPVSRPGKADAWGLPAFNAHRNVAILLPALAHRSRNMHGASASVKPDADTSG